MSKRFAILAIVSLFCIANVGSAAVAGLLLNGSSGQITVSLTSITWDPDSAALPAPGPPWNGDVSSGTTLTFTGGPLGLQEGIEINNAVPLTASTSLPENKFLQFENHPLLDFELTAVLAGSSNTNCQTLTVGQSCSIVAGSPIILTLQSGGSTGATLNLQGLASDNGGTTFASTWIGLYSTTLPGETPAQIQNFFCPGGSCTNTTGVINSSNSGSFTATVIPEPSSFVLMSGGALSLLGLLRLRKRFGR